MIFLSFIQGLNLGLSDAAILAKALADGSVVGSDIGSAAVLVRTPRHPATPRAHKQLRR